MLAFPVCAEPFEAYCDKLSLVGNTNWPPYAITVSEQNFEGFAIDVAFKVLTKLGIPIEIVAMQSQRQTITALANGEADIVISVYDAADISDVIEIVQPAIINDPITILVVRNQAHSYRQWDDLIGLRGAMVRNFSFERKFSEYVDRFLYISHTGSLKDMLQLLVDKKIDYLIGSKLQLSYAIKQAGLENKLKLLEHITRDANVYMGISKRSNCYVYSPFIKKKTKELKNNGNIDELLHSYLNKSFQ